MNPPPGAKPLSPSRGFFLPAAPVRRPCVLSGARPAAPAGARAGDRRGGGAGGGAWRAVCYTAGMDEIALYTTLEPLATWLHAHTAEVAAQAGAAPGAPLQVHPPFQGPGPEGGVVLTFAPVVGGQPLGRGSYHAALTGAAAGPPLVLQIAVAPVPDGLRLQRLTDTPAAQALWEALLAALPAPWWQAPPAAKP
jgi:hypothetical protein